MTTAEFTRTFAAAHRVWNDPGKCQNVHGHNYTAKVLLRGESLGPQNFLLPFDEVKAIIDRLDHTLILDSGDPLLDLFETAKVALTIVHGVPSTEYLAAMLADQVLAAASPYGDGLYHVTVELRETASIVATAEAYS